MNRYSLFAVLAVFAVSAQASTPKLRKDVPLREKGKEAGMLLDLTKISMGTLNDVEERKQYLSTVQLEKQRIQNYTLRQVYENAYRLYRSGDYQRAQELAQTILTIDPNFKQAQTLAKQANYLGTYGTASESQVLEAKFQEAERLYNSGRLVEAQDKYNEILTIQPGNQRAIGSIRRIDYEIANEYVRRGHEAYDKDDYQGALDNWYNALLIRKDDAALTNRIAQTENILRKKQVEESMQQALDLYNKGDYLAAYSVFERVTKIQPGDARVQKYMVQLKDEIAGGYFTAGNKSFGLRNYDQAITYWTKAKTWGFNPAQIDALIKKARDAKEDALRRKQEEANRPAAVTPKETQEPTAVPVEPAPLPETPEEIVPEVETVPGGQMLSPITPGRVTEEQRNASIQKYKEGLDAYQQDDYERARAAWTVAKQLDPGNTDAEVGLRRVEELLRIRQ